MKEAARQQPDRDRRAGRPLKSTAESTVSGCSRVSISESSEQSRIAILKVAFDSRELPLKLFYSNLEMKPTNHNFCFIIGLMFKSNTQLLTKIHLKKSISGLKCDKLKIKYKVGQM